MTPQRTPKRGAAKPFPRRTKTSDANTPTDGSTSAFVLPPNRCPNSVSHQNDDPEVLQATHLAEFQMLVRRNRSGGQNFPNKPTTSGANISSDNYHWPLQSPANSSSNIQHRHTRTSNTKARLFQRKISHARRHAYIRCEARIQHENSTDEPRIANKT